MKYRKKLLKLLKSKEYEFIMPNEGFKVDDVAQATKLSDRVFKDMIKYYPIQALKSIIVVRSK